MSRMPMRGYGAPQPGGYQPTPGGYPSPSGYPSSPGYPQSAPSAGGAVPLHVEKVGDQDLRNSLIFANVCAVSAQDFPPDSQGRDHYILIRNQEGQEYVVSGRPIRGFPSGGISLSDPQRTWCSIGMRDQFPGRIFDPFGSGKPAYAGAVDVITAFASQREEKRTKRPFEEAMLEKEARKVFNNQILSPGQRVLLEIKNMPLLLVVQAVGLTNLGSFTDGVKTLADPGMRGIVTQETSFRFFKDPKDSIEINTIHGEAASESIFKAGFSFQDLGIGGLGEAFQTLLRRAFNSRMISAEQARKLGIKHVRGILLYGPPGTGKTLIAREIGKMLNTREPKVINGPEILNKYVGQSEENVRKIFEDARKESVEKGDKSGLHLIIFDELDAVCKQRGSGAGGGTGVGDSIVNQLLSILDGVHQLDNIVLVGMTNRKDMIDEALLRPGRLEVQLEINLPNQQGRLEILQIHTKTMKANGALADDVDLEDISEKTKNYSGAEILGLVNSAASWALSRHVEIGAQAKFNKQPGGIRLVHSDFARALTEVKPAYGVPDNQMDRAIEWGIVHYNKRIQEILQACRLDAVTVETSPSTRRLSILLHGPPGAGKTALAAQAALDSGFPFVQVIGPEHLASHASELAKISYIASVFEKANRSPVGIVIIDDLLKLIEWSRVGSIYSNKILQSLVAWIGAKLTQSRRLLIIVTTSDYNLVKEFGILDIFQNKIRVDPVRSVEELAPILSEVGQFDPNTISRVSSVLAENVAGGRINLGVKHVMDELSRARATASLYRQQQKSARADERALDGGQRWSDAQERQEEEELERAEKLQTAESFTRLMVERLAAGPMND